MRKLLIALLATFTLFTAQAQASELKTIAAATFKLYEGSTGMCSTTFLKNDPNGALFLTAGHCVDQIKDAAPLNVRKQVLAPNMRTVMSEQTFYVKPVKTLLKKDVALLQVMDKNVVFAEAGIDIATPEEATALEFGTPVMVIGYPAAQALSVTKGEFTGLIPSPFGDVFDPNLTMYQTTAPVAGGNSGGGLYAQFGGTWKLIGTTTGARTDNNIMTYFQTADTIKTVLTGFIK
jgi:S1-C subfamily serine protease